MADTSMRIDLAVAEPLPSASARSRPAVGAAPAARSDEGTVPAGRLRPGTGADAAAQAQARPQERRWLYGPWVDFLLLGGGSFVVLAAVAVFFPRDEASRVALAGAMLFLAHFVNHPHFAHSYQIFYHGFVRKAFPPSRVPPEATAGPAPERPARGPSETPHHTTPRGTRAPESTAEPAPRSSPAFPLAARYRFAGIMVPAVLVAFFAVALTEGSVALLGLAANVMFFTVGWHYAKQGYGILMLDAARKGIRFGTAQRRRLLWNAHLAWVVNWLAANDALEAEELWGITYYLIDVPDPLLAAMVAAVAVSTLALGRDLLATWRAERALPLNGLLAYVAAVYVWLAASRLDPVLLFVVPFFHSLQYMAVVWRYQLNVEADRAQSTPEGREALYRRQAVMPLSSPGEGFGVWEERATLSADDSAPGPTAARIAGWKAWLRSAPAGLARFFVVGGILGFAGFWLAPVTIDTFSGYDQAVFGATLFLFIGWTFINVHHYFIDHVIWRRENPETRRHLFTASDRPAPIGGRDGQTHTGAGTAGSLRSTPT